MSEPDQGQGREPGPGSGSRASGRPPGLVRYRGADGRVRTLRWSDFLLVAAGIGLGVVVSVNGTANGLFWLLAAIAAAIALAKSIRARTQRRR